ncbi:IS1595 family transposase (plasmid) [Diaphorobacter sp. JS3051]|nr:IS1595 family transposase [Diaphorobacter sp. JS3051]
MSYTTSWLLYQKINRAMAATQDATHELLSGSVQLDDAYRGGERTGGKLGLGSENKVTFFASIAVIDHGHPMFIKLNVLRRLTSEAISKWANANLTPGTSVNSDGLGCFSAVADVCCLHLPMVVVSLKPRDVPSFKWANTVLGNLKATVAGALPRRVRLQVQPPLRSV